MTRQTFSSLLLEGIMKKALVVLQFFLAVLAAPSLVVAADFVCLTAQPGEIPICVQFSGSSAKYRLAPANDLTAALKVAFGKLVETGTSGQTVKAVNSLAGKTNFTPVAVDNEALFFTPAGQFEQIGSQTLLEIESVASNVVSTFNGQTIAAPNLIFTVGIADWGFDHAANQLELNFAFTGPFDVLPTVTSGDDGVVLTIAPYTILLPNKVKADGSDYSSAIHVVVEDDGKVNVRLIFPSFTSLLCYGPGSRGLEMPLCPAS